MRSLALIVLLLSAKLAAAEGCLVELESTTELKNIVAHANEALGKVTDNTIVQFKVKSFSKKACVNRADFLQEARHTEDNQFGWDRPPSVEKIREYTGSFYKDYAFSEYLAHDKVFIEKLIYSYVRGISGGLHQSWEYMFYYNSDGSTNDETGAILFSDQFDTIYKVYILVLP